MEHRGNQDGKHCFRYIKTMLWKEFWLSLPWDKPSRALVLLKGTLVH